MRGELFIAGNCNYRCFFCLREEIGTRLTSSNYDRFNEWIEQLHAHGITSVTISSFNAEPTIQKYFPAFVSRLIDEGFTLGLRTNGAFDHTDKDLLWTLNQFSSIWFSIQSLDSDTLYQISHVRNVPDFAHLSQLLHEPELRASIVVNRYNALEVPAMLETLSTLPITLTQVRRAYQESLGKLDEDTAAFDALLPQLLALPDAPASRFEERLAGDMRVSIWRDVLEEEKGLKYFPATETITGIERIIRPLQEKLF